jgi:hypothetical protein
LTLAKKIMQFPLSLSAAFLKRSYARRMFSGWWKLVIAALVALVAAAWEIRGGAIGMFSVFAIAALVLYVVIAAIAWRRQSKALDEWLRHQAGAPVVYSLSDEAIESSAEVASTKLKWEAFHSLSISDFDTLLGFSSHGALTLPTEQVPVEALEFLKKQFLAHGKKVEDKRKTG